MRKHFARIMKALVGLLFLAGLGIYLFRQPTLEVLLNSQLTKLGVPVHSLTVEEVSLNGLVIRGLSLGTEDELRTDKIHATWTLPGLLAGELQTIEISGLQFPLDLSGEKPPLGSLQKLLEDKGDSGNNKSPQVTLLGAKVDLHTLFTDFTVNLDGGIKQGPLGTQLIALTFETVATQGRVKGELNATRDSTGTIHGTLTVSEGALSLPEVNISGLKGNSSFSWIDNQLHEITAEFALSDITLPGSELKEEAFEKANLTLQMDAVDARIKGNLVTAGKELALSFDATLDDYLHQPRIAIDAAAEATTGSYAWRLLDLPQPGTGSATLRITAGGQTPAFRTAGDNWESWLQHSTLQGEGNLTLNGLGYAQKVLDLNGNIVLRAELADGVGKAMFTEVSNFEASGLDLEWVKRLGFPAELTALLKPGSQLRIACTGENTASVNFSRLADAIELNLTTDMEITADKAQASISALVEAVIDQQGQVSLFEVSDIAVTSSGIHYAGTTLDHLTLAGSIQGSPDAWTGELDLSADAKQLRVGLLDASQSRVTLPLLLKFNNDAWHLALREQGRITLGKLAPVESVRIQGPLVLYLSRADIELTPEPQGLVLEHQITVRPNTFTLLANRKDAPAVKLQIRPGKIVLTGEMGSNGQYNGKGTISAAAITFPQSQIQLDNIESTIGLGATGSHKLADFSIGRLRHLAPVPYFAPLSLSGSVRLRRKQLSVSASGGIPDAQSLNLTAVHALDSGVGNLKLAIDPLTFSPDALQPAALFPDLAVLEGVSGKASASSHFNWSKEGFSSGGVLDLGNLSFDLKGATIAGLSTTLELTDLLSPQSPPQQKLTIHSIDPGVPMENVEVSYQIEALETPRIAIDKAHLSMLGGILSTGPTIIDPSSTRTNMIIQVDNLDLETLFQLIDVEGLAGEGRLDGTIPITFDDGVVTIQNGELAANNPGIVRLKSEMISKLLAGRVEDVDLLLQALTEFHYTELTLKLNNSTNNDLVVALSLLGSNPNVLKGRLFRLNINLESNIARILDAIAQGYGLSNKALQRALRLH